MKKVFTISDIQKSKVAHLNPHLEVTQEKKKSKFGNEPTVIDGIKFDSIREAKRYIQLRMLKVAGLIHSLELQKEFELNDGGLFYYKYVADFVYFDAATGHQVVEDSKGFRTREYRRKKKLMEKIHKITIKET